jgi:hypothetical protein
MLEAELTQHLGYERYEAKGRGVRDEKHALTARVAPALESTVSGFYLSPGRSI